MRTLAILSTIAILAACAPKRERVWVHIPEEVGANGFTAYLADQGYQNCFRRMIWQDMWGVC